MSVRREMIRTLLYPQYDYKYLEPDEVEYLKQEARYALQTNDRQFVYADVWQRWEDLAAGKFPAHVRFLTKA